MLFWFTGSDVDPDTLVEAASSVEPTSKTAPACEADWLPGGYSWFETNASGGAAETTWVGQGGNITLTCSATPLLMPEGDGETVRFGGVTARFWEAEKPHEAETDAWEPETVGGVIISSGTISGPRQPDVATLAWTDGGLTSASTALWIRRICSMWRRACGSSEDRTALIKAAPACKARRGFSVSSSGRSYR